MRQNQPIMTFADKVIAFNRSLDFKGDLPTGIRLMNPFKENKEALTASSAFYKKYYNDSQSRHIILGINPGRFGAGLTGIPFTDPKRLVANCGIPYDGASAHEPSSAFIYEMIEQYGGEAAFYSRFYINSVCPLGFTAPVKNGREVNFNYYDSKALTQSVFGFMVESLQKQIAFGVNTDIGFCFGTGKNLTFLHNLNQKFGFFKQIMALEHPRYVMQYKARLKQHYIGKYLKAFGETSYE